MARRVSSALFPGPSLRLMPIRVAAWDWVNPCAISASACRSRGARLIGGSLEASAALVP